jgi:hypothetical protein
MEYAKIYGIDYAAAAVVLLTGKVKYGNATFIAKPDKQTILLTFPIGK